MEIVSIPIDQINPAPYNPRRDLKPGDAEYDSLKKAITEFDIVEPLVMNRRGNILVGGHQRLKVLRELGYTEVDVSVVDLPENKEKALNLALNKISGDWDNARLKDILQELDVGDMDMSLTGFNLEEIENLMTQEHQPEPNHDNKQQSGGGEVECPECGCKFTPKRGA
jgi:ParB-like chromosome segregation protein Spo0J